MKFVIQRVKEARVAVDERVTGRIGKGALVFIGIEKDDTIKEIGYFVRKIAELRMFEDDSGKMNLAAAEVGAAFLVVSQFTLLGDCHKGRRPSFDRAADPKTAGALYQRFVEQLRAMNFEVATGEFRAMMDVTLVNDGPVTFILEGRAPAASKDNSSGGQ